jgi:hypothetical protein
MGGLDNASDYCQRASALSLAAEFKGGWVVVGLRYDGALLLTRSDVDGCSAPLAGFIVHL